MAHSTVDLILTKRDGGSVDPSALRSLIDAYTAGSVPDYQMSAFLMAAFLNGMNADETSAMVSAMLHSGDVLDFSEIPGLKVDKHSTGGVGDKVSLILAPIVASCGVPVPMISGRGLGHTGGTLDKLESIPGFRTDLSTADMRRRLADTGVVLIGQTAEIAPADRKLYALRDVTGTVEFIPFIAASIMSKKLAEGIDALVLDVKSGRGAFMKTESEARRLAETLVGIGEAHGKPTVALLTDMDVPLGRAVGNWVEVEESIRCLQGRRVDDLMDLTYALAGEMLCLGGVAETPSQGGVKARAAVASGAALAKFREIVEAQGGDVSVVDDPDTRPRAAHRVALKAQSSGVVTDLDAMAIGRASVAMGAGRAQKEDAVDPVAGVTLNKKPGDAVEEGEVLAWLAGSDPKRVDDAVARVAAAYVIGESAPGLRTLIRGRFARGKWRNHTDSI